jgi:hypothetical protein
VELKEKKMSDMIRDPKLISAMQELGRGLKSPEDLAKLSRQTYGHSLYQVEIIC